jgi:putative spermidine/putrescine transport system permease protein
MVLLARIGRWLLFGALAIYLLLPIIAVALYAVATRWTANILPDGYTLAYLADSLSDQRLLGATLRTAILAVVVTVATVGLVVPASYWQRVHNPRIRPLLEIAAAIPFALPYVVIAFGILALSGALAPWLQGTVWLLGLGHIAIAFPFVYWAVDAAMAAADVKRLHEAAQTCGASARTILLRVVLPNIGPGVATGAMLAFAVSFGEFALVQILVGARFETISLYSLDLLSGTNAEFNKLAAITMITFIVVFIMSAAAVYLNRGQATRLLPGGISVERKS